MQDRKQQENDQFTIEGIGLSLSWKSLDEFIAQYTRFLAGEREIVEDGPNGTVTILRPDWGLYRVWKKFVLPACLNKPGLSDAQRDAINKFLKLKRLSRNEIKLRAMSPEQIDWFMKASKQFMLKGIAEEKAAPNGESIIVKPDLSLFNYIQRKRKS